jgi:hypothetical protein
VTPTTEQFIYRLDTVDYGVDLNGVIDFCAQAGGYPIYGKNAYEWHLIQGLFWVLSRQEFHLLRLEIMFKDQDFTEPYVYTGLRSPTKQVTDVYFTPQNISVSIFISLHRG